MITKKDIPLELLKAIGVFAQENLHLIQLKREDNTYYSFIETDVKSKNYSAPVGVPKEARRVCAFRPTA